MFKFPPRYIPGNNVLALYPPYFPAWTTPLANEPYDAGIPARATEDGLRCIVDPWSSMNEGDEFKLYWDDINAPVYSATISAEQVNNRLVFSIEERHIVNGDANPVFYTVTRFGQNVPEEPETKWNLLVKLDRPGGFDEDQATPGHSGLLYSIPQAIIDTGVGPGEAAAGVPITIKPYLHMRRNDRINLAWGSENVYRTVLEAEVGQEIIITVTKEIIEAAGDSNGVAIAYQVVDVCGNYPGGTSTWSAVTTLLVDLGNNRLDAPLVLVGGFPVEEIDLEQLAGADVIVRVTTNRTDHAVGDTLRMTWVGTPAEGTAVIVGPLDLPVTSIPSYCDFIIPYADVAAIAMGRASVNYVRIRSGEANRPSKSAAVTVIGEFRRYAAPGINEAVGSTLDPALNFYTISVPYYAGRNPGDELFIVCEGHTASGAPTYYDDYASVGGEAEGAPVLVNLPKAQVQRLDGGSLTVYYSVNGQSPSDKLTLSVGVAAPSLPIPTVENTVDDVLDPEDVNPAIGANVTVPYTATVANDVVVLRWRGSSSNAPDASRTLTANTAGKPVPFSVPFTYVSSNLNGTVDVSYSITRGTTLVGNSIVRRLRIGSVSGQLPAPSIDEAVNDHLDPSDVPASGATVRIDASARLRVGDTGEVRWVGVPNEGSATVAFRVLNGEEGQDKTVNIPLLVIEANDGHAITLDYTINRAAGGPPEDSPPAVYDVSREIGSGLILVMGARGGSRSPYWTSGGGAHHLTALNTATHRPLEAQWQYEGDSDEPVRGSVFRDTQPWRLLHVRTSDDEVRINPANLFGNGNNSNPDPGRVFSAFVARRDRGNLLGWGLAAGGGSVPGTIITLTDIVEVTGSVDAFAARRANGSVVAWGYGPHGGEVPAPIATLTDIVQVVATAYAFAVRRANGAVVAWGRAANGSEVPSPIATLTDIEQVGCTDSAFAARRANGHVVAWGDVNHAGSVPGDISTIGDIVELSGTHHSIAARRANGHVVAWGNAIYGGSVPAPISTIDDIETVVGTSGAFAAQRATGHVVAWGHASAGGVVPAPIATLNDIVDISNTGFAFAARRASGHVVAWGDPTYGGTVPSTIATLDDIMQVIGSGGAFAALRANGTVVAWGLAAWGGDISGVADQLVDVRAIYGNPQAFAALTSDGRVVTWGLAGAGGNSDAVQGQLRGNVSYEATPASRGVGSMTLAAAATRA